MYTTDELGRLAQSYYKRHNGYCPPEVAVTDNGNYTFTIQLYETKDNGDGTYHTATSAWNTVGSAPAVAPMTLPANPSALKTEAHYSSFIIMHGKHVLWNCLHV